MGNIILTTKCSKGCSYCFARDFRNKNSINPDMDFEYLKEIIQKHKKEKRGFKLLGGEPTEYPLFKETLEFIKQENIKEFLLVSNVLYKEDIRNTITEFNSSMKNCLRLLANSTDLDKANRYQRFSDNILALSNEVKKQQITLGLTIDASNTVEYYINYINDYLIPLSSYVSDEFRLSLSFPGEDEEKSFSYIINNKKYGNLFFEVFKYLRENNFKAFIDCIMFPCMLEDFQIRYIKDKLRSTGHDFRTSCSSPAIDMFANGDVSYCYPTKSLSAKLETIMTLEKIQTVVDIAYYKKKKSAEYPSECIQCKFFKSKECEGPCMAFF